MPLTRANVLDLLSDPIIYGMEFRIGPVRVSGVGYRMVRENILAESIQVVPGNQNLAFYDNQKDTLITQVGDPPPNLDRRAQLLHECTHALNDIADPDNHVTRHYG
jgi:hypothetical protein